MNKTFNDSAFNAPWFQTIVYAIYMIMKCLNE